jgi:hypothetical protein
MNVKATGPARRLLETILTGPHDLVLSEFLLTETARVLGYPRFQKLYRLTSQDIAEHVELLRARGRFGLRGRLQTDRAGGSERRSCRLHRCGGSRERALRPRRDFYAEAVVSFCREQGIEIMDDVTLLEGWSPRSQPRVRELAEIKSRGQRHHHGQRTRTKIRGRQAVGTPDRCPVSLGPAARIPLQSQSATSASLRRTGELRNVLGNAASS